MGLNVSTVVDISTRIAAGGVPRVSFGTGLLLTVDDSLPSGGPDKVKIFNNLATASSFLGSGAALDAAAVWFSAEGGAKSLYVGRWATSDIPTSLVGGVTGTTAQLGVANAAFVVGEQEVSVDLSSASTFADIATAIETATQALATGAPMDSRFSGATFEYDTDHFVLELTTSDDIGGPFESPAAGTDISELLGMDAGSSPTYQIGADQETAVEAITAILTLVTDGAPIALMLAEDAPDTLNSVDTRETVAAFAEGGDYIFGQRDTADQALVANDTTSESALAFAAQQSHVAAVYTRDGELPDVALMATMSAQDLNQPASIITPHAKALAGVLPTDINATQLAELTRKRTNVYTNVGGLPSLVGGYTSKNGNWLDAVWWLLWAQNELVTGIWNAMRGSRRLTNAILVDELTQAMQTGVRNGGIQPGRKASSSTKQDIINTTGNTAFDGVMVSGYVIWVEPIAQRASADIDNRIGRLKVWVTGSEAIHKVLGDIIFSN